MRELVKTGELKDIPECGDKAKIFYRKMLDRWIFGNPGNGELAKKVEALLMVSDFQVDFLQRKKNSL